MMNLESHYKKKYLKYKFKYKKLKGGAVKDDEIILFNELFYPSKKLIILRQLVNSFPKIYDDLLRILPDSIIILEDFLETTTWTQDLFYDIGYIEPDKYIFITIEAFPQRVKKEILQKLSITGIFKSYINDNPILQRIESELESIDSSLKLLELEKNKISIKPSGKYIPPGQRKDIKDLKPKVLSPEMNLIKEKQNELYKILNNLIFKRERLIDLTKGGNIINLPKPIDSKIYLTMVDKISLEEQRHIKSNQLILEYYYPTCDECRVMHIDEILCLIPYTESSYKIWLYQPIFESDAVNPEKEVINDIWRRNYEYLQRYYPIEDIILFPTLFNLEGHIINPPLFNNIIWFENDKYKLIFPIQKESIKELINLEIVKINESLEMDVFYIDTEKAHRLNGNLHCLFKLISDIR